MDIDCMKGRAEKSFGKRGGLPHEKENSTDPVIGLDVTGALRTSGMQAPSSSPLVRDGTDPILS
jgi:hypothetical protein